MFFLRIMKWKDTKIASLRLESEREFSDGAMAYRSFIHRSWSSAALVIRASLPRHIFVSILLFQKHYL
jgi:hypothetical protein